MIQRCKKAPAGDTDISDDQEWHKIHDALLQLPRTGLAGMLLMAVPFTLMLAAGILLTVKARRK